MTYQTLKTLGSGSFGTTYLIKYKGGFAAMKEMNDKADYEKSKQECLIMLKLNHNNIVRIYEYNDDKIAKKITIIMEYCKYGSLKDIIKKLRDNNLNLSEYGVLHYFVGMILGLQYLHHHNVLHRDLKTDNIFINADNIALIGDFGWSKQTTYLTTTVAGTPLYMAPELLKDAFIQSKTDSYSTEVDIYSLGCILHELCTNEPPYFANNTYDLMEKQRNYSFDNRVPDNLIVFEDIIRSCLNCDHKKRPSIDDLYNNPIVQDYIQNGNNNFFYNSNTHPYKLPRQAVATQPQQQYKPVVEHPVETNPMYNTIITHNENDTTNNQPPPQQQQPLLTPPPQQQQQQQSPYQPPPPQYQQQFPQQQQQQQQPISNYGVNPPKTLQPQSNIYHYGMNPPLSTFPPNDQNNQYYNPATLNGFGNGNYQQDPPKEKKRPKLFIKKTTPPSTLPPSQPNIQLPSSNQQPREDNKTINYPFVKEMDEVLGDKKKSVVDQYDTLKNILSEYLTISKISNEIEDKIYLIIQKISNFIGRQLLVDPFKREYHMEYYKIIGYEDIKGSYENHEGVGTLLSLMIKYLNAHHRENEAKIIKDALLKDGYELAGIDGI